MTYPNDRALVKAEIAKKIAKGYYPEQLWGNHLDDIWQGIQNSDFIPTPKYPSAY
jgi:hypothetical protein